MQDCANASLSFTNDSHVRITSGEQTLDAAIVTTPKDGGFLISLTLLGHHSKANCQGISADYVAGHFAPYMFVRVTGSTLTFSMLDKSLSQSGPSVKFERDGV